MGIIDKLIRLTYSISVMPTFIAISIVFSVSSKVAIVAVLA